MQGLTPGTEVFQARMAHRVEIFGIDNVERVRLTDEGFSFESADSAHVVPYSRVAAVRTGKKNVEVLVDEDDRLRLVTMAPAGPEAAMAERMRTRLDEARRLQAPERTWRRCATCGHLVDCTGLGEGARCYCPTCGLISDQGQAIPATRAVTTGTCEVCRRHGRVDEYNSATVTSCIVLTWLKGHKIVACPKCGGARAFQDFAHTLLLGWWGIPVGILTTPVALVGNLREMGRAARHRRDDVATDATSRSIDLTKDALEPAERPEFQYALGWHKLAEEKPTDAIGAFGFAARTCPNYSRAWAMLATLRLDGGNLKMALQDASRASTDPLYRPLLAVVRKVQARELTTTEGVRRINEMHNLIGVAITAVPKMTRSIGIPQPQMRVKLPAWWTRIDVRLRTTIVLFLLFMVLQVIIYLCRPEDILVRRPPSPPRTTHSAQAATPH